MNNRTQLATRWIEIDADFHKAPVTGRSILRVIDSVSQLNDVEVAELLQDLQD